MRCADSEDGRSSGVRVEFVLAVGELGGDDGGEGVLFDQVLASGVESGDRDVSEVAIEGEGEMLGITLREYGLEICGEEVLIQLLSGLVQGLGGGFVADYSIFFTLFDLVSNLLCQ